jgi:hypothetical protein
MRAKQTKAPATGPRACLRSRTIRGACDTCGETPEVLHVPLRLHGWYCPEHCPCCNPAAKPTSGPVRPPVAIGVNPLRMSR